MQTTCRTMWERLPRVAVNALYIGLLSALLLGSCEQIFHMFKAGNLLVSAHSGNLTFADFLLYYMRSRIAFSVDAHHIYDPAVQLKWFNAMIAPAHIDLPIYNVYVPFVFVLWRPLSVWSPATAYVIWAAVGLAGGLCALLLLLRKAGTLSPMQQGLVLLAAAASFPGMMSLRMGQQSWFLLALECLFFWSWLSRRDIIAGGALSLLTFKPHYALFLAIPALAGRRYRLLLSAVLIELILLLLAVATIGWENVISYPAVLLRGEGTPDSLNEFGMRTMVSIRGISSCFLPEWLSVRIGLVAMAGGLAGAACLWIKAMRNPLLDKRFAIGLTLLICLLASPHTFSYDLLMLAPLAITLPVVGLPAAARLRPVVYRVWCLLIIAYPLVSWCVLSLAPIAIYLPFQSMFLLNAVLLATGVACLRAMPPAPPQASSTEA